MILTKLNRYLYEAKRKEISEIINLNFDEIVEKYVYASDEDKKFIISKLDEGMKKDIDKFISGGLL